jgi:hypothetical protein
MGNFISSNAVQAKSEPSQLLMIGLDWAGKTTILYKIKKPWEKVITSIPTIGFDIKTTKTHGTVFMAWDAGGRAMICPLVKKYYDRVEGIIFVIDSSDMRRFEFITKTFSFKPSTTIDFMESHYWFYATSKTWQGQSVPTRFAPNLAWLKSVKTESGM